MLESVLLLLTMGLRCTLGYHLIEIKHPYANNVILIIDVVAASSDRYLLMRISLVLVLVFLISVCTDPELVLDNVSALEENEIQSVMRDLAASISVIEDVNVDESSIAERRKIVLDELDTIQRLSEQLRQDSLLEETMTVPVAHPAILQYLDRLSADVESARQEVLQPSPDFYIAEKVAGTCLDCHEDMWTTR